MPSFKERSLTNETMISESLQSAHYTLDFPSYETTWNVKEKETSSCKSSVNPHNIPTHEFKFPHTHVSFE